MKINIGRTSINKCIIPTISLFILNTTLGFPQTWVQTPVFDFTTGNYSDSMTVGPQEMAIASNGMLYALTQTGSKHSTYIYSIDPAGNINWYDGVAVYGGIYTEYAYSLRATADNGCIFIVRHVNVPGYDNILKYDSTGNVEWNININTATDSSIKYVIPSHHNTYYMSKYFSLTEIDSAGQVIQSRGPFTENVYPVSSGDFIYQSGGAIIREDFAGNVNWSIPDSGYDLLTADTNNFYLRLGADVKKFNSHSGLLIWSKPMTIHSLYFAPNGQILSRDLSGDLSRYDSNGDLLWTKSYSFPYFGFSSAIIDQSDFIIAGGAYLSIPSGYLSNPYYSAFFARLDDAGIGVIDSTVSFFNGNANINTKATFADDGCYIAAALGNTGTGRDSVLFNYNPYIKSVFGTKWSTGFNSGLNHLFSDVDGNGVIDTSDLWQLSYNVDVNNIPGTWRIASGLPEVSVVCPVDTPQDGDTLELSIVIGTPTGPVDSIYSFSITIGFTGIQSVIPPAFHIPVSSFGDPSINLFSYIGTGLELALCRTDSMNAYVAGDTVAKSKVVFTSLAPTTGYYPIYFQFNAISYDGYSIPMTANFDSLYLFGINPGIEETALTEFNIFPNPASDILNIETKRQDNFMFDIYNSIGQHIYSDRCEDYCSIDVSKFPFGLYTILFKSEKHPIKRRFLVSH